MRKFNKLRIVAMLFVALSQGFAQGPDEVSSEIHGQNHSDDIYVLHEVNFDQLFMLNVSDGSEQEITQKETAESVTRNQAWFFEPHTNQTFMYVSKEYFGNRGWKEVRVNSAQEIVFSADDDFRQFSESTFLISRNTVDIGNHIVKLKHGRPIEGNENLVAISLTDKHKNTTKELSVPNNIVSCSWIGGDWFFEDYGGTYYARQSSLRDPEMGLASDKNSIIRNILTGEQMDLNDKTCFGYGKNTLVLTGPEFQGLTIQAIDGTVIYQDNFLDLYSLIDAPFEHFLLLSYYIEPYLFLTTTAWHSQEYMFVYKLVDQKLEKIAQVEEVEGIIVK